MNLTSEWRSSNRVLVLETESTLTRLVMGGSSKVKRLEWLIITLTFDWHGTGTGHETMRKESSERSPLQSSCIRWRPSVIKLFGVECGSMTLHFSIGIVCDCV